MENPIVNGLLLVSLLLLGCLGGSANTAATHTPQTDETHQVMEGDVMDQEEGNAMQDNGHADDGAVMEKATYTPFTQAAFDQAKTEGKVIFLEFYANWCPTCQVQKPKLEQGFTDLNNPKVVGFQVNYKDSETDGDEQALAQQYGITYQHTHVIIDSNENLLLKELTDWSAQETVEKLNAATAQAGA
ncbi:thioredoxin family protein [Candidatus Micrarchaeota archaeon]|nr:thioredoxin family protein [Candidatus Micrarchaeota archaeon]